MMIDTKTAIYDLDGRPLDYPCSIMKDSYLIEGSKATRINTNRAPDLWRTQDGKNVDDVLRDMGLASIGNRVPQVAFGANRNLENLVWKFSRYRSDANPVSTTFLAVPGYVLNCDVVACNVGYWGYIYAGLLAASPTLRPYLMNRKCPVAVLFLDQSQMNAMHVSEGVIRPGEERRGVSCEVGDMQAFIGNEFPVSAQVYSLAVPFLSFDTKQPVAFKAVATEGRCGAIERTQEEMFAEINRRFSIEEARIGRVPIAETLMERTHKFLDVGGPEAAASMSEDDLYIRTRSTILSELYLRDEDGEIRHGLQDVVPIRGEEEAWDFSPLFSST